MSDLVHTTTHTVLTQPPSTRDSDGYADLSSYASVGNGRTIALIAEDGRIDWLPVPTMDAAPLFGALLDGEEGGWVSLQPTEDFTTHRRYLPGTDVLETTFVTDSGEATVTDAIAVGALGVLPWTELVRHIQCTKGSLEFHAEVVPGTLFRTASPWVSTRLETPIMRVDGITLAVRSHGAETQHVAADRLSFTFRASEGSSQMLALVATEGEPLPLPSTTSILGRLEQTVNARSAWSSVLDYHGPYEREVITSSLLLRQLMLTAEGSIAAAATTSLPESFTTPKNWDYRLFWLRDAAFALSALYQLNVEEETHAAMSSMLPLVNRFAQRLVVLAALDGSDPGGRVKEHHVPGWRGSQPVVTGNRATDQLQLSVYGDIFNIIGHYVAHGNVLDDATARLMCDLANQAADHWRLPDSGIWELPEVRQYTTSKLGCWQALDQAVRLHEAGHIAGEPERWRKTMEDIRRWVHEEAWSSEMGAYEFYPGSGQVDASILLHAISGFDRGERMRATLSVLRDQLGAGPHLYRFSGAAQEEGAFTACSFWMVSAQALTGDLDGAHVRMADLIEQCPNDVGVMAEMVDPRSGAAVGNLPQALSHLALIHAAVTLESENDLD